MRTLICCLFLPCTLMACSGRVPPDNTPNATGLSPADVDLYRAEHKGRMPPGPTITGR